MEYSSPFYFYFSRNEPFDLCKHGKADKLFECVDYFGCTRKNLNQNKMTINFSFIIDIRFMNSFLILIFFKKGLTKKSGVLIISLVKIFKNGGNT